MTEDFLHYIWRQELFNKISTSDSGENIEIISTGIHNKDAGPDFLNARIKIDNTIWAGNIEIHTESANWEKHNHHTDRAYDNVILHVSNRINKPVFNSTGRKIPSITLDFEPALFNKYEDLVKGNKPVPCLHNLKQVDNFIIKMWLNSLIAERLEDKTEYIKSIFENTNHSWEDTFYIVLARNFGFKTNAVPFELLAKSIPLKILSKYRHNLVQLEALLFGQAGFLTNEKGDEYYNSLKKEYEFLRKAHQLKPIENHLWKFLRLRPTNFPTIRIAQFANLVHKSQHLFSKTIEAESITELFELFDCSASGYWTSHFRFSDEVKENEKALGKSSISGILINTIIPFLFLYGKLRDVLKMQEKSIILLEQLAAEKNHIIENWSEAGIKAENALQSQALLQLSGKYCSQRNCLYCQIGNEIIRKHNL